MTEQRFTLPALPYDFNALQPYISEVSLSHHYKLHAEYVKKANELIEKVPHYIPFSIEQIIKMAHEAHPELYYYASQHYNHSIFWNCLSPESSQGFISKALLSDIENNFGSIDNMFLEIDKLAEGIHASAWIFLTAKEFVPSNGNLQLIICNNGDSPLVVPDSGTPVLAIDMWEHAYYLDFTNANAEYITNICKEMLNWKYISDRYASIADE